MGTSVDMQRANGDRGIVDILDGRLSRRRCIHRDAPSHRAKASEQFTKTERFCDVVVGSEFEAENSVEFLATRRHHDDRNVADGSQFPEDVATVEVGKTEIEEDHIESS